MARINWIASAALATIAALAPVAGNTTTIQSPAGQVVLLYVYPTFGNGDVVFTLNAALAGCDGYWLSPADAGFKQAYAALLSIKISGGTLAVYAQNDVLWTGSGGDNYCRVYALKPT